MSWTCLSAKTQHRKRRNLVAPFCSRPLSIAWMRRAAIWPRPLHVVDAWLLPRSPPCPPQTSCATQSPIPPPFAATPAGYTDEQQMLPFGTCSSHKVFFCFQRLHQAPRWPTSARHSRPSVAWFAVLIRARLPILSKPIACKLVTQPAPNHIFELGIRGRYAGPNSQLLSSFVGRSEAPPSMQTTLVHTMKTFNEVGRNWCPNTDVSQNSHQSQSFGFLLLTRFRFGNDCQERFAKLGIHTS